MQATRTRHKLTAIEAFAQRFAAFCIEQQLQPADGAQLVALARRVFVRGVRFANSPRMKSTPLQRARDQFRAEAEALGYEADFAGRLWPALTKGGRSIDVPTTN